MEVCSEVEFDTRHHTVQRWGSQTPSGGLGESLALQVQNSIVSSSPCTETSVQLFKKLYFLPMPHEHHFGAPKMYMVGIIAQRV